MVERIMQKLQELGLTANAVEKKLGFGNGAIKRFATNSPSIDKIVSLSNMLNVSIDWLVTGKENESQLTENETELLHIFSQFSDREQLKIIGQLENELKHIITPVDHHEEVQEFEVQLAAYGGGITSQTIKMTPSELQKWIEEQKKFAE